MGSTRPRTASLSLSAQKKPPNISKKSFLFSVTSARSRVQVGAGGPPELSNDDLIQLFSLYTDQISASVRHFLKRDPRVRLPRLHARLRPGVPRSRPPRGSFRPSDSRGEKQKPSMAPLFSALPTLSFLIAEATSPFLCACVFQLSPGVISSHKYPIMTAKARVSSSERRGGTVPKTTFIKLLMISFCVCVCVRSNTHNLFLFDIIHAKTPFGSKSSIIRTAGVSLCA